MKDRPITAIQRGAIAIFIAFISRFYYDLSIFILEVRIEGQGAR
jgi:hypothetical protein